MVYWSGHIVVSNFPKNVKILKFHNFNTYGITINLINHSFNIIKSYIFL